MRVAFGTSTPTSMTVVATSTLISPAERGHRGCLSAGFHPPVHETDAPVRQRRRELGVRDRGLRFELVRFLDQGADPIRLTPFAACRPDALDDVAAPRVG